VRAVEQLRREGRTVLIHCVQAQSRTPTIAALYGARLRRIANDEALADVCAVLPDADPIPGVSRGVATASSGRERKTRNDDG
jgi:protein-tyrosine phosphatase